MVLPAYLGRVHDPEDVLGLALPDHRRVGHALHLRRGRAGCDRNQPGARLRRHAAPARCAAPAPVPAGFRCRQSTAGRRAATPAGAAGVCTEGQDRTASRRCFQGAKPLADLGQLTPEFGIAGSADGLDQRWPGRQLAAATVRAAPVRTLRPSGPYLTSTFAIAVATDSTSTAAAARPQAGDTVQARARGVPDRGRTDDVEPELGGRRGPGRSAVVRVPRKALQFGAALART